jgi:hypothetical protein
MPESFPGISRIFSFAISGWFMIMGPSINPTIISGLPLVSSINAVRLTKSKGFMVQDLSLQPSNSKINTGSIKEEDYDFSMVDFISEVKLNSGEQK